MVAPSVARAAPQLLLNRLHDFRVSLLLSAVAGGLARWTAALLALGCLLVALDWALDFPAVVRGAGLVGWLGAGVGLWRAWVAGPVRRHREPFALARLVEARVPGSADVVSAAVQLIDDGRGSADLRDLVIVRASEALEGVSASQLRDPAAPRLTLPLLLAALAVTLGGLVLAPAAASRGVARLSAPYAGYGWTTLELISPAAEASRLARGEPFALAFRLSGYLPGAAELTLAVGDDPAARIDLPLDGPASAPGVSAEWDVSGDGTMGEAETSVRLDAERVPRSFRFRLRAGRADSGWRTVAVLPPPALVPLDGRPSPRLTVSYPGYTGVPAARALDGASEVEAVTGSLVEIAGATDRPVARVELRPRLDKPATVAGMAVAPLGVGGSPLAAVGALAAVADAALPVSLPLDAERTRFAGTFAPRVGGLVDLVLTDDTGLRGSRLLDVRLSDDPIPVAKLDEPPARDELAVTPEAALTTLGRADDRRFGLRRVAVEAVGPGIPLQYLERLSVPPGRRPAGFELNAPTRVADLRRADGTPPRPGDRFELSLVAWDADDVTPSKGPGRTPPVAVRVVTKAALEESLQQRQSEQLAEVAGLRDAQKKAREKTAQAQRALESGAPPADALAQADQAQRELRDRLSGPASGLQSRLERLDRDARDNGLADSPTRRRAETLRKELDRVAGDDLQAIEGQLAEARRQAEAGPSPGAAAQAARRAQARQAEVEERLGGLLERLQPFDALDRLRGELRESARGQRDGRPDPAELAGAVPPGKSPDRLAPAQRERLERDAGRDERLAERLREWDEQLGREIAGERAAAERQARERDEARERAAAAAPAGASDRQRLEAENQRRAADAAAERLEAGRRELEALEEARRAGGAEPARRALADAARAARENRQADADRLREEARKRTDGLLEQLKDRPAESPDRLGRKRKQAADRAAELRREQDALRRRAEQADRLPPEKQAEARRELAREQEQLQRLARQLARDAERQNDEPAADALRRAERAMDQAREALEQGEPPVEAFRQAEQELQRTERELGAADGEAEQKLLRESLQRRADKLKGVRDRHRAARAEAARVQAELQKAGRWSRALAQSLADLADRQDALAREAEDAAGKDYQGLPVLERAMRRAVEAMDAARDRTRERAPEDFAEPLPPEAARDAAAVDAAQAAAGRRLDQLIDALEQQAKADQPPQPGGAGGGGASGNSGPPGDPVPPAAQLRVLRALQAEALERTAAFDKAHPDRAALDADAAAELEAVRRLQADVNELLRGLLPTLAPAPGAAP